MRGHLTKRSPNSWTMVLELGRDPVTRKRRQRWETVKGTKRDAERRLAELIHQTDKGMRPDTGKATVEEYLNTWLRDVVTPRREPRTTEGYGIIINCHIAPAIGAIQLTKLDSLVKTRFEEVPAL